MMTNSSNNHFLLFLCLLLCTHYAHSEDDDDTKRCPKWISSKQKKVFEKCVLEYKQFCGRITCARPGKTEEHLMGCVEEDFCMIGEDNCSALTHDPKPQFKMCSVYGPYIGPISEETDKPPPPAVATSPKGSVSELTTQKSVPSANVTETPKPTEPFVPSANVTETPKPTEPFVPSANVTETPKPTEPIVSTTMASGAGSAAIMFGIFLQAIVVAVASLFGVLIH